ncbi:MAG: acyltransferase [Syntrophaceae bacterium]|nr:acyltransferase [Syntrophaceae bacterium]
MTAEEKKYYPYFDYLRIILASVVMFGHDHLIPWAYSAGLAVDVFFALSGWLIGNILIRTEGKDLPKFYFNRAMRIWVPYYIALFFILAASLMKDPINLKWFEFVTYKLTWVYNIFGPPQLKDFVFCMPLDGTGNHFWSVNAEEQFYLLAPLLLVAFANYGRQIKTWILIIIALWFMGIYASISFGVLSAITNNIYPEFHTKKLFRCFLFIVLLGASAAFCYTTDYKLISPLFSISTVLLLAVKRPKHRIGSFLGGISYPLYLNHWIGVFFFNFFLEPFGLRESWVRNFLSALMNYGIASFLYWFIERKILEMRGYLYTVRRGIGLTVLAYTLILTGLSFGIFLTMATNIIIISVIFAATAFFIMTYIIKHCSAGRMVYTLG